MLTALDRDLSRSFFYFSITLSYACMHACRISCMTEICRIGQNFLHPSFILHNISPYPLVDMCRKCQILVSRTCRKSCPPPPPPPIHEIPFPIGESEREGKEPGIGCNFPAMVGLKFEGEEEEREGEKGEGDG